jgi:hypothetical protein
MKKLFLLCLLVGITFLSCSDNIDNPIVSSHSDTIHTSQGQLFAAKIIDGEIGDELILNETFNDIAGNEINVYAHLRILENSFPGTVTITMIPNVEDLSIQLFPEMTFNRSVRLDLSFSGINLEEFGYTTTGTYDFAHFANNGDTELIESDISQVNIPQNKISVQNAKLNHFSRYGWIR